MKKSYLFYAVLACFVNNLCAMQLAKRSEISKALPSNSDALAKITTIITPTITPQAQIQPTIDSVVREIKALPDKDEQYTILTSDETVAKHIVDLLAQRFNISHFDAAAALNTAGARKWVEKNLPLDQFALFQATQQMITRIRQLNKEPNRPSAQECCSELNPCSYQTASGLLVHKHHTILVSPWGTIQVTTNGNENHKNNRLPESITVSAYNAEDIKAGTLYSVNAVDGSKLPTPQLQKSTHYVHSNTVAFIWQVLRDWHQRTGDAKEHATDSKPKSRL